MTPRQKRIYQSLYDDLQNWRFVKQKDPNADMKLVSLIKKIDKVFESEAKEVVK